MAVGWYALLLLLGLLLDPAVWLLSSVAVSVILWANARSLPPHSIRHTTTRIQSRVTATEDTAEDADEATEEDRPAAAPEIHAAAAEEEEEEGEREQQQQHQYISMRKAVLLPVLGSVVLLVLFFLLNIVKYVFFVVLALSACMSLTLLLEPLCSRLLVKVLPRSPRLSCGQPHEHEEEAAVSLLSAEAEQPQDDHHAVSRQTQRRLCRSPLQRLCRDTLGVSYVPYSVICAFLGAVIMLLLWITTNHWLVLDTLAISLAVTSLSSLRLQSIKVSLVFLLLFFLYDIFWVFLSSYFFSESVMESVARNVSSSGDHGLDLPILIRCPKLGLGEYGGLNGFNFVILQRPVSPAGLGLFHTLSNILHSQSLGFMMLGLGDIILPGIFINFLRRFDYVKGYHWYPGGYTTYGLTGYIAGLLLTFIALILLQRGQPALLYLVPCILIPTILAAWKFGDLAEMWKGFEPTDVPVPVDAEETKENEQESTGIDTGS